MVIIDNLRRQMSGWWGIGIRTLILSCRLVTRRRSEGWKTLYGSGSSYPICVTVFLVWARNSLPADVRLIQGAGIRRRSKIWRGDWHCSSLSLRVKKHFRTRRLLNQIAFHFIVYLVGDVWLDELYFGSSRYRIYLRWWFRLVWGWRFGCMRHIWIKWGTCSSRRMFLCNKLWLMLLWLMTLWLT